MNMIATQAKTTIRCQVLLNRAEEKVICDCGSSDIDVLSAKERECPNGSVFGWARCASVCVKGPLFRLSCLCRIHTRLLMAASKEVYNSSSLGFWYDAFSG